MPLGSLDSLSPLVLATTTAVAAAALRIALVAAGAWCAVRFTRAALGRLEALLIRAGQSAELVPGAARKRVTTLTGLLSTAVHVTIWGVAGIIVLGQLGLDITPVLAGAGRSTPLGVRGIGRSARPAIAAVFTDAVHHAIGVRVRELPVKIGYLRGEDPGP